MFATFMPALIPIPGVSCALRDENAQNKIIRTANFFVNLTGVKNGAEQPSAR
jgi:hypothetical protein